MSTDRTEFAITLVEHLGNLDNRGSILKTSLKNVISIVEKIIPHMFDCHLGTGIFSVSNDFVNSDFDTLIFYIIGIIRVVNLYHSNTLEPQKNRNYYIRGNDILPFLINTREVSVYHGKTIEKYQLGNLDSNPTDPLFTVSYEKITIKKSSVTTPTTGRPRIRSISLGSRKEELKREVKIYIPSELPAELIVLPPLLAISRSEPIIWGNKSYRNYEFGMIANYLLLIKPVLEKSGILLASEIRVQKFARPILFTAKYDWSVISYDDMGEKCNYGLLTEGSAARGDSVR